VADSARGNFSSLFFLSWRERKRDASTAFDQAGLAAFGRSFFPRQRCRASSSPPLPFYPDMDEPAALDTHPTFSCWRSGLSYFSLFLEKETRRAMFPRPKDHPFFKEKIGPSLPLPEEV